MVTSGHPLLLTLALCLDSCPEPHFMLMPDPNNTPCSVAEALGFLQHNLCELSERQSTSEDAIHTTLVALSAQLQQLMLQLNTPALEGSPVPPPSPPPMVLLHLI